MNTGDDFRSKSRDAFSLWSDGKLPEAAAAYEQLLASSVEPTSEKAHALGEYAGLLATMGRHADALATSEAALAMELALGRVNDSAAVAMARYWLGEHALQANNPELALSAVGPSLRSVHKLSALLHVIESLALWALGRPDEARGAAQAAINHASSHEQRDRIRARLPREICEPDPSR